MPNCLRSSARRARLLVGVAAERERARRVADALDVEAGDLLLEAALAEQHHLLGHEDVVEMQFRPFFARHEMRLPSPANLLRFDEDGTDAADAGAESHVREDQIRVRRMRGKDLRAVDAPAPASRVALVAGR